jgi:hypothetical protein
MTSKSDLLFESLSRFFEVPQNSEQLQAILTHRHGISLRNLEWFVTNYSKNRHVTYQTSAGKPFTVHVAYKSSLDGYSKKLFDPFCRTARIQFQGMTTTVAQLNFIRWCITNGVIEYLITRKGVLQSRLEPQEPCSHNRTGSGCTLRAEPAHTAS